MNYIFYKNIKNRIQFKNFEIKQKVIKALFYNLTLPTVIRRKLGWQLENLSQTISLAYVKNCCILSGRFRSVYKFFNLSRLVIKRLQKFQFLPGLQKSS